MCVQDFIDLEIYEYIYKCIPNIDMHGKSLKKGSIVNFLFVGGLQEISSFSFCNCHDVGPLI